MKGYQAYRKTSIQTADRAKVIVMLYEKAISHLNRAIIDLEEKTPGDEWSHRVNKALEIIKHLSSALDFDKGGEIAVNLSALYDYIRDVINEGNITRNTKNFEEAVKLLSELLEGWRRISDEQSATRTISTPVPADSGHEDTFSESVTPMPELANSRKMTELIA